VKSLNIILKYWLWTVATIATVCFAIIAYVQLKEIKKIYTIDTAPRASVIIVLGAAVTPDGQLSDALSDRVKTGATLYKTNHADMVLLTGDGGGFHRDEITPMHAAIVAAGVADEIVLTDERGFRTYESCKRAAEMGVTDAIIVTQRFHLARALYLCDAFGIHISGVPADLQPYRDIMWNWTRDLLASLKAFIDIHIWAPQPPA
jgi:SanA protein